MQSPVHLLIWVLGTGLVDDIAISLYHHSFNMCIGFRCRECAEYIDRQFRLVSPPKSQFVFLITVNRFRICQWCALGLGRRDFFLMRLMHNFRWKVILIGLMAFSLECRADSRAALRQRSRTVDRLFTRRRQRCRLSGQLQHVSGISSDPAGKREQPAVRRSEFSAQQYRRYWGQRRDWFSPVQ